MSRFLLSPLRRRAWVATAGLLARESPSLTAFPGIRPVADGRETRRLQLRGQPRLEPCSRFTREGTVAGAPWIAPGGRSRRTFAPAAPRLMVEHERRRAFPSDASPRRCPFWQEPAC